MGIDNNTFCVTDCSLIDLETCRPVTRRDLLSTLDERIIQKELHDEDGCYNSSLFQSSKDYAVYETFSLSLSILTVLTGLPGLAGNMFVIAVLLRKEMKNCFNHILIALNICDSLHILFAILDAVRNSFVNYYPQTLLLLFPYFHYPFYRISLCGSIYLIISVAIERYLAVCRPHHYRAVQSQESRSVIYILPSILLALIVNTTRFLETETGSICVDFSACHCSDGAFNLIFVKPTMLRLNRHYIIYYGTWGWVILTGLLPFLLLIFLNSKIYISLQEIRRRISQSSRAGNRPLRSGCRPPPPVNQIQPKLSQDLQSIEHDEERPDQQDDDQQQQQQTEINQENHNSHAHNSNSGCGGDSSDTAPVAAETAGDSNGEGGEGGRPQLARPLSLVTNTEGGVVTQPLSSSRNISPETLRERRTNQQNRECNLAVVLLSSVLMFFVCHLPRLLTSVYEAVMIHSILYCREKAKDLTPLWFLYLMSLVQYLQVVNAAVNLPIYLFASKTFQTAAASVWRALLPGWMRCSLFSSLFPTPDQGGNVSVAEQLTQPLSIHFNRTTRQEEREDC